MRKLVDAAIFSAICLAIGVVAVGTIIGANLLIWYADRLGGLPLVLSLFVLAIAALVGIPLYHAFKPSQLPSLPPGSIPPPPKRYAGCDCGHLDEVVRAVVLTANPGDLLVFNFSQLLPKSATDYAETVLAERLPGYKCVVFSGAGSMDMAVVNVAEGGAR